MRSNNQGGNVGQGNGSNGQPGTGWTHNPRWQDQQNGGGQNGANGQYSAQHPQQGIGQNQQPSSSPSLFQVLSSPEDRQFVTGLTAQQRRALNQYTPEQIQTLKQNGQWEATKQNISSVSGSVTTRQATVPLESAPIHTSTSTPTNPNARTPGAPAPSNSTGTAPGTNNGSYTFKVKADGTIAVYQNGKVISSGTDPGIAHTTYGYVLPKSSTQQVTAQTPMTPPASARTPSSNSTASSPVSSAPAPYTFVENYSGSQMLTVAVYQNGKLITTAAPDTAAQNFGYRAGQSSGYKTTSGASATNLTAKSEVLSFPTTTDGLNAIAVPSNGTAGNGTATAGPGTTTASTPQIKQTTTQTQTPSAPPSSSPSGLPTCPSLAIGFSGLPSCTNGQYVFVPTGNNTTEVFQNGEMLAAGMPAATAAAKYGYNAPSGSGSTNSTTQSQSASTNQPSAPVYTFKETQSGTVEIYQNGQRISTGTPQYAAQFGYTGPGSQLPASSYNQPQPTQTSSVSTTTTTQSPTTPPSISTSNANSGSTGTTGGSKAVSGTPTPPSSPQGYTFKPNSSGTVDIYQNGQKISTGSVAYAEQLGYVPSTSTSSSPNTTAQIPPTQPPSVVTPTPTAPTTTQPSNTQSTVQPTLNLPNGGQLGGTNSGAQNVSSSLANSLKPTPQMPSTTMSQSTPPTCGQSLPFAARSTSQKGVCTGLDISKPLIYISDNPDKLSEGAHLIYECYRGLISCSDEIVQGKISSWLESIGAVTKTSSMPTTYRFFAPWIPDSFDLLIRAVSPNVAQ